MSAVVVTMLLVAQGFLLEHEIEHALSGDDDSCVVCQLAANQGDVLIEAAGADGVAGYAVISSEFAHAFEISPQQYFSPRAPPLSY